MKRTRAFDNDPDFGSYILGTGAAHHVAEGGDDRRVAGHIYPPDPESRHGWREAYVRAEPDKPVERRFGIKR